MLPLCMPSVEPADDHSLSNDGGVGLEYVAAASCCVSILGTCMRFHWLLVQESVQAGLTLEDTGPCAALTHSPTRRVCKIPQQASAG
jgi:hypothetical protein